MKKYDHEFFSSAEKWELENKEQLNRLAKLLRKDVFQKVSSLSYRERCTLEKMTEVEDLRMKGWRDALSSKQPDVLELSMILNKNLPDVQSLVSVCAKHGLEAHMDLLLELFSEGKRAGMAAVASKRSSTKSSKASSRNVDLGRRWLALEREDSKKYGIKAKVAIKLSEEFPELAPESVTKLLQPRNYPSLFPEGVEAARNAAGLPPWPREEKK